MQHCEGHYITESPMTIGILRGGEKGAFESPRVPFIAEFVNLQYAPNIIIKAAEKRYRKLFSFGCSIRLGLAFAKRTIATSLGKVFGGSPTPLHPKARRADGSSGSPAFEALRLQKQERRKFTPEKNKKVIQLRYNSLLSSSQRRKNERRGERQRYPHKKASGGCRWAALRRRRRKSR